MLNFRIPYLLKQICFGGRVWCGEVYWQYLSVVINFVSYLRNLIWSLSITWNRESCSLFSILEAPSKICSRRYSKFIYFFFFYYFIFHRDKSWHFMWIVCFDFRLPVICMKKKSRRLQVWLALNGLKQTSLSDDKTGYTLAINQWSKWTRFNGLHD